MTVRYRSVAAFDQEELEGELILMEPESQAVVTLNGSGRVVWDALQAGATLDELVAMFGEASPDTDGQTVRHDVRQTLETLVEARLVTTHDNDI